jgi:O-antigen/teichoic acid export membrane protein
VKANGTQGRIAGLFTGSSLYLISNIANAMVPFLLLPLLTRYLAPEEYGLVSIFQALTTGLLAFVGLNTVGAAVRHYYDVDSKAQLASYVGGCFKILAISALAVLGVMLVLRKPAVDLAGLPSEWLLLSVLASAGLFAVNMRLGLWQVQGKALAFGSLQVSLGVLNAAITLILVIPFGLGAEGRMAAILLAPLLLGCISIVLLRNDGLLDLRRSGPEMKEALAFGVPLAPHVLGLFLLSAGDRFVINSILGAESVGIYMVAMQISLGIGLVFDAFNKAFVPWLFARLKKDEQALRQQIVAITYSCFGGAFLLAGGLVFAGPILVYLLAGKDYHSALDYLGILAFGQAFHGLYLMVTNYAFYARKTGLLSLVTMLSGVLGIVLLWLVVPVWGLQGAAMAYLATMATRFLLTWGLAQYCHPMPWFTFRNNS